MAAAETNLEYLALAKETVRGTAVTPPTHIFPLQGMMNPRQEISRSGYQDGTWAENRVSTAVRRRAEWSVSGSADVNYAPILLNGAVKPVTTPTTPTSGVLTRLWTFVPNMGADDLSSFTVYWGDPNAQIFQSAYNMVTSFGFDADATGTDAMQMNFAGTGKFPAKVTAPTLPALTISSGLQPTATQVWLDVASAIGTTAITGRLASANFSCDNGLAFKYLAQGPGGDLSFARIGRNKRHAESNVVFELADMTQYDVWAAASIVKLRVRVNGNAIETVTGPLTYYEYIQWDIYGTMDADDWGDVEGTNRALSLTVMSQTDPTLGADFSIAVQNTKTTL
jgi:hypothetical protein